MFHIERTVVVGNHRTNVSEAGIWVDTLDEEGRVISSRAMDWAELEERNICEGMSLYEGGLPSLERTGT
jgi:hypothetical protein